MGKIVCEAGMILIQTATLCGCGVLGTVQSCAGNMLVYACTIEYFHQLLSVKF